MGDAQSAPEGSSGAAEEASGAAHGAPAESLINEGQISEINVKADSFNPEVSGHCEDELAAEAVLSPGGDVSQTETPLKEETPLENVEMNEKESPNEADANEAKSLEMTEMDAKQNDINEGFRRFFSNIGLKLTVDRGSGEIPTDVPNDTDTEEPNRPEDVEDATKETTSENAEQDSEVNVAQETYDNDSTTCPTMTDMTSEEVLENAEEKAPETKAEVESSNADAAMTSPLGEDANQDTTTEEEPRSTSPSSPEEEAAVSPIRRFFTTGIFSGLQKKKNLGEDETTGKEMKDIGKKEVVEKTEQTAQDQQRDEEDVSVGVEAAAAETEHEENKPKGEIRSAARTMDASPDPLTIIVTEPEVLSSQEKDKVQASPLKRLLSGSGLKKLSKKQRSRKSSDANLSDSGEHVSDHLLSSTETAENQKEEGGAQPSTERVGEEDGAWASFKRLLTPKKRMKRSSLSNEETQIPGSVEEPKPSEGGQISDHSTEETKKRKDSSVSWDAVLCRSGRRRSRKTSDSDDETPQIDNINKQDGGSKNGAESAPANEVDDILASSPEQAGSPSEGEGASTWKSLKRLVTPKRKAKDDKESKDHVQSDSEVSQDEYSFSIKKLLPGRKKRKSAEKQDQVSSDEADNEAASGDEDSDTPAVVPLSEFDTVETEVHIQTQANVESHHIPKEADFEQDRLDPMAEPVLPCDNLQTQAKTVQGNDDAPENQATTTPDANEKADDLTESDQISKQQLSDIPEEATPASATEDAARDDTIAEDLIEITSEAITAAEHLDITLADETEMISAVSQLSSDSSKTSGNTTPVPAEYVVEETDVLLHQVVETISISPETVPVCSYELRSERKVFSVSQQILETFVKPTILELHRSLDTTEIHTGFKVEELDANNDHAATTQIESIFEVNDLVSTEILSEVPTEEYDTAENTGGEVQEVDVTHPEDSVTELESIDESYYLVECLSEGDATGSTNRLPEGDKIVPDKGSLIEAHQTETEHPKLDHQEADLAATVANETKDGAMEQEVPSVTNMEDQVMHNITDQIQAEDFDQQPVEVEDLQALTLGSEKGGPSLENDRLSEGIAAGKTVELKEVEDEPETDAGKPEHVDVPEASEVEQASTLDSEEGSVQSPKEEVKSEDNLPAETVTDEPKQSAEVCTEVSIELGKKERPANAMKTVQQQENIREGETDEYKEEAIPLTEANLEPVDASKTEHVQEPEVLEAVQAPTLESEEGSVQSFEKEVISDNVPEAETVTDEPKQTAEGLTEVTVDSENKELPVNVMETVQPTLDSEGSIQSHEKEVISEIVPEGETDEPKEENISPTEDNLEPVDASKTEHLQEPEVLEAVQAPTLDSEEGSVQSPKEEVRLEDIPTAETVTDEPKQSEDTVQDSEVFQAVQSPTLDSEVGSVQSHKKEVISDNIPEGETDEPTEETIHLTEANLQSKSMDASKAEELKASKAVQAPTLDSEEDSVQSPNEKVKSEDIPTAETVTDEPKQTAEGLTEVSIDSENKELPENVIETVEDADVFQAFQVPTLDSEEGSVQSLGKKVISEIVPEGETDEPKEETITLNEANHESMDASKAEELKASKAVQAPTLDSEEGSVQSPKEEVKSEDIPTAETVTDEPKQTEEGLTEVSVESENKELPMNVMETVQEQEVSEAPTLESEVGSVQSFEKEVISDNVPEAETFTDEPKQSEEGLTEVSVESEDKELPVNVMETVQEQEVSEAPTLESEVGSVQSFEKEVISDNVPEAETFTDEPKQSEEVLTEVSVESEDKELPVNVMETVQEPEVFKAVQAPTLYSEEGSVQSLEENVISEIVPEGETGEPKEETIALTEANLEPVNASKTEHVQELQASEAVQAPILDSEEDKVQSPKEEDIPTAETVTHEPEQSEEGITEVSVESENKELPMNVMETVQEQEVSEAVPAPTLDSEEGSVQSFEKEVISDNIPEAETVTDEPKQTAEGLTEVTVDSEDKELPVNVIETDQEPEAFQAVQAPTLDSEVGSVQSLEKEVVSEIVPEGETDEPKEENISLTEDNLEPANASKTEHVQEPEVLEAVQAPTLVSEVGSVQSHEKEVVSEIVPEGETVIDEPKQTAEHLHEVSVEPADASETEHVQVLRAEQAAALDSEVGILLSFENKVISEDVPEVDINTDELKQENEVEPEEKLPVEAVKTEHAQEPEGLPSGVKYHVTETNTDEGTPMCMHVVPDSIEGSSAQEFEKQIVLDEVAKANIASVIAAVTDGLQGEGVAQPGPSLERAEDPKKEGITQDVGVEQGQCIPEAVDELLTLKEVCVSSVNEEASSVQVLEKTELTKDTPAPCVDNAAATNEPKHEVHLNAVQVGVTVEKEREFSGTEIETAEEEHAAVEHAVVEQVVICDIKAVPAAIPKVLTEETTHRNAEKVDNLSATLEIEEEVINEQNKELLQKVIQHVKENVPETLPESLDKGQEGVDQPDAVTQVSETVDSESSEVEDQKELADGNASVPETSTAIGDVAATGKQVPEDLVHTSDVTPHLDVSIQEKSEAGVAVEEVKSNQMTHKEPHTIQRVTPTNTGLVDPQNTGVLLSIGNVESPSSLSIEVKLNIQFGRAGEPASPPPITERSEPVEKTDASEVRVQAVEPAKTIKRLKVTEVAVQATATTALASDLDSKARAVITTPPVLLDICIRATEPGEQVKARERETSGDQAPEPTPPGRQTEEGDVSGSPPAPSGASDPDTKAEEPAKQKEEDQDVWTDAEEDVDAQEKRLAPQTESEREGKAGLGQEVEMAPDSTTEEEERRRETPKTVKRRETDSEGEDSAVALEHPETASVTTMERN